jgi:hypothetical protein
MELSISGCGRYACCCSCNYRAQIFFPPPPVAENLKKYKPKLGETVLNPMDRFIGTEIEVSGLQKMTGKDVASVRRVIQNWGGGVVHDGSVHDGFEINTGPAAGDHFIKMMKELSEALRATKARANSTCGYHVHIDTSDFSWWDMRKLVALYTRIESGLFRIIAPSREQSDYCEPCADVYMKALDTGLMVPPMTKKDKKAAVSAPKKALLDTIYETEGGRSVVDYARSKYGNNDNRSRYWALNIHSWMYRGTVEFRHHHGTTDGRKLINWALLCCAIVETAHKEKESTLMTWPLGVAGLVQLAPTLEVKDWVKERFNTFHKAKDDLKKNGDNRRARYLQEDDNSGAFTTRDHDD